MDNLEALNIAAVEALVGPLANTPSPCATGGNNRVYRIQTATGPYIAKCYFISPHDPRDRLMNEWRFLSAAETMRVPNMPRPIAYDTAQQIAIHSYLEGSRPHTVTANMVAQAGEWFCCLNANHDMPEAQALPEASEVCLSAQDYLSLLQNRIASLKTASALEMHQAAFEALHTNMDAHAAKHAQALVQGYGKLGINIADRLPRDLQCLSPSDFGFHNSLITHDARVQWIDFEYAGWDDPAKTICDFMLHPGLRVDSQMFHDFWSAASQCLANPEQTLARARLLYPLFCLRWCCIILNVFDPIKAQRRRFSAPDWDEAAAQKEQLTKAQVMLEGISHNPF